MKSFIQAFFSICLMYGTVSAHENNAIIPTVEYESVWLWQIDTPHRKLYIAGDWHDHVLISNEKLSHQLAYSAYNLSSRVLTEGVGVKKLSKDKLENRLTPGIWNQLKLAISQSVIQKQSAIKSLTPAQRSLPTEKVIDFVNHLPNSLLLHDLVGILLPLPENQTEPSRVEIGFLKEITFAERKKYTGKQIPIERFDDGARTWEENCGQASDTEEIVSYILNYTSQKPDTKIQDFLTEFKKRDSTTQEIGNLWKKAPTSEIFDKCSTRPRNLAWMKKITQLLKANGDAEPLMIVVGIGHVIGENGLLSLLCKEGFCKADRVLQVN